MSFANPSDVYYRPGVNCIVTSVKSAKEVNLRFVLGKKQYTVAYLEKKKNFDSRNLSQLLKGSEAVKAAMWNVPFGPPGSNKRTWYVTDIWTPHIKEMKKNRIPEPTISIVCRVNYNLGKDFLVCELGKNFCRDLIILPRDLISYTPAVGKDEAEIGDYLLVTALIISETQGDEQKLRLTPIWAHWDRNNRGFQSVIHLNLVESGSGKSTLIIQDQIPCMWGVVQAVYKKSMKVYVTALSSSISVQYSAVYQYDDSSSVKEGDWLQLWLTPKASQPNAHLSEITTWVCTSCCTRSKRDYNNYLRMRLKSNCLQEESENAEPAQKNVPGPTAPARKVQSSDGAGDQPEVVVGLAKVHQVKEKSGTVRINSTEYVFHLGIMSVYGIKMSKIKNVKIKDLVDVGCEIRYKLNAKSDGLKSVWIGPEFVTFKHLNFMPQLMQWMKARNLDTGLVKEMMREITENFDAVNKNKETELPKATKAKKEKSSKEGKLSSCSSHASQTSLVSEGGSSADSELISTMKNINLNAEHIDFISFPDEVGSCSSYTKEEVEELEKLWWSEDSDESDDELRPIMRPTAPPNGSGDNADGLPEQMSCNSVLSEIENGKSPLPSETEKPEPAKPESLEEKAQTTSELVSSVSSSSSASLGAEGFSKTVEDPKLGKTEIERASMLKKQSKEDDAKPVTRTKHKDSSGSHSLIIMMELTKFLIEKGKAKSIPEAGELSAEFVALLEDALKKTPAVDIVTSVDMGTQTEISGPVKSTNVELEGEANISQLCSNEGTGNSLSLVD